MASRRRRFLTIAVLASVAVHVAAALVVVLLPRILPHDIPQQEQGTIELLMVEEKGAQPKQVGQQGENKPVPVPPQKSAAPAPQTPAPPTPSPETAKTEVPPKGEAPPSASKQPAAPTLAEHGDEPTPPPSEQPPPEAAKPDPAPTPEQSPKETPREAKAEPVPPSEQKAPVFDLEGTDSESNAIVMGDHVLPALPDDHFRNRPPIYPMEAQTLGEHGEVVVTIHVGESGLAAGADITESSGFRVLDEAVLTAVRKWHFHPALKDGQAIPFDMPFRFIFEPF